MSESTEQTLIETALTIGNIADSNSHYTAGFAARIDATGKIIGQLTISELLALDQIHRKEFNRGQS